MHVPKNPHLRAAIEISFIVFLFYSNLLMGEFTATAGRGKSLSHALLDIFTRKTIAIAVVTAIAGHLGFETLRKNS
jgi:hypothetical protein